MPCEPAPPRTYEVPTYVLSGVVLAMAAGLTISTAIAVAVTPSLLLCL